MRKEGKIEISPFIPVIDAKESLKGEIYTLEGVSRAAETITYPYERAKVVLYK